MSWKRILGPVIASALLLLYPTTVEGVWPMPHEQAPPLLSYPCDSASHPCNYCTQYSQNAALQLQVASRSERSNDTPDPTYGACNYASQWCKIVPQLQTPTYTVVPVAPGQAGIRINVGYDFPNNYCLVWEPDNPAPCYASNWPIPATGFSSHLTRLQLWEGANNIYDVPAIFENGTWRPTIVVTCDGTSHTHTYTITATNHSPGLAGCGPPNESVSMTIVVTFPDNSNAACHTPDLRPCPECS